MPINLDIAFYNGLTDLELVDQYVSARESITLPNSQFKNDLFKAMVIILQVLKDRGKRDMAFISNTGIV